MLGWMRYMLQSRSVGEIWTFLRNTDTHMTSPLSKSKEELKNLLMKVKEESEKVGLKVNIQKMYRIQSHHLMANRWGNNGNGERIYFGGVQNHCWNSNTLATPCKELTHWKRPWCWEGLGAGGEGDDRGWDGWMASPTRWTWVWVNSGSWWWTGRPGVLRFMGSQRVGHDWATELNWTENHCRWRLLP